MEIFVRELKSRLSATPRRAAGDEEIVVTPRGKVMARLLPPHMRAAAVSAEAAALARFRALPWVRAGSGEKPALPKLLIRSRKGEKTLAQIMSELRG